MNQALPLSKDIDPPITNIFEPADNMISKPQEYDRFIKLFQISALPRGTTDSHIFFQSILHTYRRHINDGRAHDVDTNITRREFSRETSNKLVHGFFTHGIDGYALYAGSNNRVI